jgi:hypothetical protein
LSKDIWHGDYLMPISLNRWNYAEGNPIINIDPSGFINEKEGPEADQIVDSLRSTYGVRINKDWGYILTPTPTPTPNSSTKCTWDPGTWKGIWDLKNVKAAIVRIATAVHGTSNFKNIFPVFTIEFRIVSCGRGCTYPGLGGNFLVTLKDSGRPASTSLKVMDSTLNFDEWTVVHEMGHVWDLNNNGKWHDRLVSYTNGHRSESEHKKKKCTNNWEPGCNSASYFYGDKPPKGSDVNFNPEEDFAESFAGFVFPNDVTSYVKSHFKDIPQLLYSDYTKTLRYSFINDLVNGKIQ